MTHRQNKSMSIQDFERQLFDEVVLQWKNEPKKWKVLKANFSLDDTPESFDNETLAEQCLHFLVT